MSLKYFGVAILFSVWLNGFADTSTNGPRPIRTRELKPPAMLAIREGFAPSTLSEYATCNRFLRQCQVVMETTT